MEYTARWDALKGGFVDEPRQAVAEADQLVRELLDELQEVFRTQREGLEQGLDADEIHRGPAGSTSPLSKPV